MTTATVGVGKRDAIEIHHHPGGAVLRYQHTVIHLDADEARALSSALDQERKHP